MISFGHFIRSKRRALGIPQQALADACNFTHRGQISKLESGLLEWKLSQVTAIAPLFGMTAGGLLSEWEGKTE